MSKTSKPLPAIRASEKILEIIVDLDPEEIKEALRAIGTAGATYGTMWGLKNIRTSGMDLDFYEMKGAVLEFCQKIQNDNHYHIAVVAIQMMKAKNLVGPDQKGQE